MSSDGLTPGSGPPPVDPKSRAILRYTLSVQEYSKLHAVLKKRVPLLQKKAPEPAAYAAALSDKDDFNPAAVRAAVRVFLVSRAGLGLYDALIAFIRRRRGGAVASASAKRPLLSDSTRLSLSLSALVFLHRVLHRFFLRLRFDLLSQNAAPFRRRNPRVARALTSRLAPAIGASLAGFALGGYPADQFRRTVAIYVAARAAEFAYNALEDEGIITEENRPWWFGSWMLLPPAFGQLLHAFLFDRDCFPAPFGMFIMRFSPTYMQARPEDYPANLPWPSQDQVVDGLAAISKLKYPAFVSPILYPSQQASAYPEAIQALGPILQRAHPAHTKLVCATLHPADPSCVRAQAQFYAHAFPRLARFFAALLGALSLLRLRALAGAPLKALDSLSRRVLRLSAFVSGAIGTSWGAICALQALLPPHALPTQRWFWGGFVAGLWGYAAKNGGRSQFLYCFRASAESTWRVGKKHGWWKGVRGGDLMVIVAGMAVINALVDREGDDVLRSKMLARGVRYLKGSAPHAEDKKDKREDVPAVAEE